MTETTLMVTWRRAEGRLDLALNLILAFLEADRHRRQDARARKASRGFAKKVVADVIAQGPLEEDES